MRSTCKFPKHLVYFPFLGTQYLVSSLDNQIRKSLAQHLVHSKCSINELVISSFYLFFICPSILTRTDFITYSFVIHSCTHSINHLLTPQILLCIFGAWLWSHIILGTNQTHLLSSVRWTWARDFAPLNFTFLISNMGSIKPATRGGCSFSLAWSTWPT